MNKVQLIEELEKDGFSKEILDAFRKVKREDFVPENLKEYAYENEPLSIGFGATISQPYTIAFMLNLLELDNLKKYNLKEKPKILEVGSGSGYVLALISEILKDSEIYGVERIKILVERSKKNLKNYKNIKIFYGDGTKGLKEKSPFDRILVSASYDRIPKILLEQLKKNGILVMPVKNSIFQIKKNKKIEKKEYPGFVFVPLIKGTE